MNDSTNGFAHGSPISPVTPGKHRRRAKPARAGLPFGVQSGRDVGSWPVSPAQILVVVFFIAALASGVWWVPRLVEWLRMR